LGYTEHQSGIYPLALRWFEQISWKHLPVLVRFEGLAYVREATQQLKATKNNPNPLKTPQKTTVLATSFLAHWFGYFNWAEQAQLVQAGFKAFTMGIKLASHVTPSEQSETGLFAVPEACLLMVKEHRKQAKTGQQNWKATFQTLKRGLRKTPAHLALWFELADFYLQVNHPEKAMFAFERCIALSPACAQAQLDLGHLYHDAGRLPEAVERYLWAFSTANSTALKRQAAFALSMVMEHHAKAVSLIPLSTVLSVSLSLLLKQEQEPLFSNSGTSSQLAKVFHQAGWHRLAYWHCLKAVAVMQTHQESNCLVNLAYMATQNQCSQEALYYYMKSIENNATDASLHNSLGQLYFDHLLQIAPAQQAFERAIVLDPSATMPYYNLGQVYGFQQQWTMAAQAFTTAKMLNEQSHQLDVTLLEQQLHQLYENL
jgi:tetratricopeptide (TPR) repeat protein